MVGQRLGQDEEPSKRTDIVRLLIASKFATMHSATVDSRNDHHQISALLHAYVICFIEVRYVRFIIDPYVIAIQSGALGHYVYFLSPFGFFLSF